MIRRKKNLGGMFLGILTLGDLTLLGLSYLGSYLLRFRTHWMGVVLPGADNPRAYWYATPVVLGTFWVVFKYLGLYKNRRGISSVDEFRRLLNGTLFSLLVLSALAFFIREINFSIKVFLVTAALSLFSLLVWRTLLRVIQMRVRQRGLGVAGTVVVGSGTLAKKLVERIRANPGLGYHLLGLVDDGPGAKRGAKELGLPLLGGIASLGKAVKRVQADCVIVALPASLHAKTHQILLEFDAGGVDLRIVSDLYGFITSPMAVDEIHGIPVFALKDAPLDRLGNRVLKRVFDLGLGSLALLLAAPLMAVTALLVKLDSPGAIFYSQERVGLNNRVFRIFKFRTMRADAEAAGPGWTKANDARRTRLGGFLRRTSLDELPQLVNVLKGNMSLVGPRPERPHYVEKFRQSIPRYLQRHQVKAGITGWAQVHGLRGDTSIEERTSFDLYYVENWSLSLDLLILFKTALELFEHETAY